MVLMLLLAVAAAGAALCMRAADTARLDVLGRGKLAARWAAEAGVARARASLSRDAAYEGGTFRLDAFDVSVRISASPDGRRSVRAVASSPSAHAAVEAKLRLTPGLPAIEGWAGD
jgi:hypothetical protein